MNLKNIFGKAFKKEFERVLVEKLNVINNSAVTASVIGRMIDNTQLSEQDVIHLVARLCCKYKLHPVIYRGMELEFVFGNLSRKIKLIGSTYN